MSKGDFFRLMVSKSLQTTLVAEEHLAEGQFLIAGQTYKESPWSASRDTKANSLQNRRTDFRTKVNLNKDDDDDDTLQDFHSPEQKYKNTVQIVLFPLNIDRKYLK
jgi:hypothetical protein